jgi:hypothetical protein
MEEYIRQILQTYPRLELSARRTQLRSAPWTENEPYFCGLSSFPAARTEYSSCDIQREPALEITSRKNYLEGG